ncbi:TonB-dependent siderophore receptor [Methylophilus sp. OH31]|uniref:TonB-dependent siderophore receptor n=1 Tax=Methylophilus sp. OH31 TaxID=1387312 RepID=UPI000462F207|nr:TonB-dependent siderophore receptor [Methylophilus sp. OH31]
MSSRTYHQPDSHHLKTITAFIIMAYAYQPAFAENIAPEVTQTQTLEEVTVTSAQEELKQAPGVSVITAEDIAKRPPTNDLSEIIRTMPGVNLTGNSTSGQRGNNRQIDIRGMGPENTLILIDGRPVSSRNSVRYGWRGERDTRGDTNWVPPEQVERIEILRGPAAARYGNGAAGGVVNIITKAAAKETHGSVTAYTSIPEDSVDGSTRRLNFGLSGPISDNVSYRIYGNLNKTNADDYDINEDHASPRTGIYASTFPAGREGVRNRDLNGRLSWQVNDKHRLDLDATFSRQGNIYAGEAQNTNNYVTGAGAANAQRIRQFLGRETNIMYRENYALTHHGKYDFGTSMAYLQYEHTRNDRLNEGLAGGTEGLFSNSQFTTSELKNYTGHAETSIPGKIAGLSQVLTVGSEWVRQTLDDPNSVSQTQLGGTIPGLASIGRNSFTAANIFSVFVESNIALTDNTLLIPGLRFDQHSRVGDNWSPALNLSHTMTDNWTLKTGIARAYKAPNLYQLNTNYLLYSAGNGCYGGTRCYLQGNDDLNAEHSINKELGIEYKTNDVLAGLTFFRNDYKNKIDAGLTPVGQATTGAPPANIFQWTNIPDALVQGFEGTLKFPLLTDVTWTNNFTYMTDSINKKTNDALSIIPKYTVNSVVDWKVNSQFGLQGTMSLFGKQKPKKYDYQGNRVTGDADNELDSYALFGINASYQFSKQWRMTTGVSNLFDKRLYRRGNASGVSNAAGAISGAGAETYNEPGRAFYVLVNSSF